MPRLTRRWLMEGVGEAKGTAYTSLTPAGRQGRDVVSGWPTCLAGGSANLTPLPRMRTIGGPAHRKGRYGGRPSMLLARFCTPQGRAALPRLSPSGGPRGSSGRVRARRRARRPGPGPARSKGWPDHRSPTPRSYHTPAAKRGARAANSRAGFAAAFYYRRYYRMHPDGRQVRRMGCRPISEKPCAVRLGKSGRRVNPAPGWPMPDF